ncbi:MAG: hypothetical protein ACOCQW_02025 [Halanaerobiaceae bacterium]
MYGARNKSVILMPMRIEVYHYQEKEIWIRWYPDELQISNYINTEKQKVESDNYMDFFKKDYFNYNNNADMRILPSKLRLYTYHKDAEDINEKIKFLAESNMIPNSEDEGLKFSKRETPRSRWLYDFNEAINKGMGIKFSKIDVPDRNSPYYQIEKADWLILTGYKADKEDVLNALFSNHKKTGKTIIQGNTEFSNIEPGHKRNINKSKEMKKNVKISSGNTNGEILAAALDIEKELFNDIEGADLQGQDISIAVNNLLWDSCTWSYYQDILKSTEKNINEDIEEYLEKWNLFSSFFKNNVTSKGLLPSINYMNNTYSILPVTDIDNWESMEYGNIEKYNIEEKVAKNLRKIKKKFMKKINSEDENTKTKESIIENIVNFLIQNIIFKNHSNKDNDLTSNIKIDELLFYSDDKLVGEDCKEYLEETRIAIEKIATYDYKNYSGAKYENNNIPQIEIIEQMKNNIEKDELPLLKYLLFNSVMILHNLIFENNNNTKIVEIFQKKAVLMANIISSLEYLTKQKIIDYVRQFIECLCYRLDSWLLSLAYNHLFEISDEDSNIKIQRKKMPEARDFKPYADRLSHDFHGISIKNIKTDDELSLIKNNLPLFIRDKIYIDYRDKSLHYDGLVPAHVVNKIRNNLINIDEKLSMKNTTSLIGVYGWLDIKDWPNNQIDIPERNHREGFFQAPSYNHARTGIIFNEICYQAQNQDSLQMILTSRSIQSALSILSKIKEGKDFSIILNERLKNIIYKNNLKKYLSIVKKCLSNLERDEYKDSELIDIEAFRNFNFSDKGFRDLLEEESSEIDIIIEKYQNVQKELENIIKSLESLGLAEGVYQTLKQNIPDAINNFESINNTGKYKKMSPEIVYKKKRGRNKLNRIVQILSQDVSISTENPRIVLEPAYAEYISSFFNNYKDKNIHINIFACSRQVQETLKKKNLVSMNINLKDDLKIEPVDLVMGSKKEIETHIKTYIIEELVKKNIIPDEIDKSKSPFEYFNDNYRIKYESKTENNVVDIEKLIKEAKTIKENLNKCRPLSYEDVLQPSETKESEKLLEIAEKNMIAFQILLKKLQYLMEILKKIINELRHSLNSENRKVYDILKSFKQISKFGFSEINLDLLLKFANEKYNNILEEMTKIRTVNFEDDKRVFKIDNWSKLKNPVLKYKISKKILNMVKDIIKNLLSDSELLIMTPFIPGNIFNNSDYNSNRIKKVINQYKKKGIKNYKLLESLPSDRIVFSRFGAHKSKEEIRKEALLNSVFINKRSIINWDYLVKVFVKCRKGIKYDIVNKYFWHILDDEIREIIEDYMFKGKSLNENTRNTIINGFNKIIERKDFYHEVVFDIIFEKIKPTDEIHELIKQDDLSTLMLLLLNRNLLSIYMQYFADDPIIEEFISLKEYEKINIPTQIEMDIHYILSENKPVDTKSYISAFVIDEWSEFIPVSSRNNGLAFSYDYYQNKAPRAILVAVPSIVDVVDDWKNVDLARIVSNAIDLIYIRNKLINTSNLNNHFKNDSLGILLEQWKNGDFKAVNGGRPVKIEITYQDTKPKSISRDKDNIKYSFENKDQSNDIFTGNNNLTLITDNYSGGPLKWYDFYIAGKINLNSRKIVKKILPMQVKMNSSLFKELAEEIKNNDNLLNLSKSTNLYYYLDKIIGIAKNISNWFIVPHNQEIGSLRYVNQVKIIDNFGFKKSIAPFIDDGQSNMSWDMYSISGKKEYFTGGSRAVFYPNIIFNHQEDIDLEKKIISYESERWHLEKNNNLDNWILVRKEPEKKIWP